MQRACRRFSNGMVCFSSSSISVEYKELSGNENNSGLLSTKVVLANRLFESKDRRAIVADTKRRLDDHIAKVSGLLKSSPGFAVPEVRSTQIVGGSIPTYVVRQINRRGVVVVREALPKSFAHFCNDELLDYVLNSDAWSHPPNVYDVKWSHAQVQVLMHPHMNAVVAALNGLWRVDRRSSQYSRNLPAVDMRRHTIISDGAFVGNPRSPYGPKPAMIGPGLRRWTNPSSSSLYRSIFDGNYEQWDAFDAAHRLPLVMNNKNPGVETFTNTDPAPFIPWHGLISLSRWPGQGTLRIVPMMRVGTAFVLLRPFFEDVDKIDDVMLGASDDSPLEITKEFHGQLLDALVQLPPLYPGDAVFWHPDLIIADGEEGDVPVDRCYAGMFFSSMPLCAGNAMYVEKQREDFLLEGYGKEAEFSGRATLDDLTHMGRCLFGVSGWSLKKGWPGSRWVNTHESHIAIKEHNSMLGIRHEPHPRKY